MLHMYLTLYIYIYHIHINVIYIYIYHIHIPIHSFLDSLSALSVVFKHVAYVLNMEACYIISINLLIAS